MKRAPREFTGPIDAAICANLDQRAPRTMQPGLRGLPPEGDPQLVEVVAVSPKQATAYAATKGKVFVPSNLPHAPHTAEGWWNFDHECEIPHVDHSTQRPTYRRATPHGFSGGDLVHVEARMEFLNAEIRLDKPTCRAPSQPEMQKAPSDGYWEIRTAPKKRSPDAIRELYGIPNWVKYFDAHYSPHLEGAGLINYTSIPDNLFRLTPTHMLFDTINHAETGLLDRLCYIFIGKMRKVSFPNDTDDALVDRLKRHILESRGEVFKCS